MYSQICAVSSPSQLKTERNINRRHANYHPNIWGDRFLSYDSSFMKTEKESQQQLEELKQEIRRELITTTHNLPNKLHLINTIHCLGLAYHFDPEIQQQLEPIFHNQDECSDLYSVSLRFRLLRQQGFHVSCAYPETAALGHLLPLISFAAHLTSREDSSCSGLSDLRFLRFPVSIENVIENVTLLLVKQNLYGEHRSPNNIIGNFAEVFNQFQDDEGNFKKSLIGDVQGLLEFYEATHFRIHGEDILEKALDFTIIHLESMAAKLDSPLSEKISHALKQSMRKRLPRVEARRHISFYQQDCSHNEALLKMAVLDFNLLQTLHRKELSEISRWWKDLNFATKVSFARDRMVECYFWILSVFVEPQYSFARISMTKIIALASVFDDIYDVYGTLEELTLLTEAIVRWDISIAEPLPECMKLCFQALQDVFMEMEEQMAKKGKFYCVQYAKNAMKEFLQAYYVEAKWLHEGYLPTMEEYMGVALVSCGYPMLTIMSFTGMEDFGNQEALEWVSNWPTIVRAAATISRLMDDIVSYKFEKETGKIATSIECYVKQYGVTEEEACEEFNKQIGDAWKDINGELLNPTAVPMQLLTRPLNLARVMDVLYKDGDNYTNVGQVAIDGITSLLIDPIPV